MDGIRSLLFVPGDSEREIAKGLASAADALILDLEVSVAPERRTFARSLCRETIEAGSDKMLLVRVNALDTEDALLDLAAAVRARPFGIMLPKGRLAGDLRALDHMLSALEVRDGIAHRTLKVLPIVTSTGASMFGLNTYGEDTPRLIGALWGGEDLAADIGALANRDAAGRYAPTNELAHTFCLLAGRR